MVHSRAKAIAELAAEQATELLSLYDRMLGLLAHNSAQSIDWGGAGDPPGVNEDASGNIDGLDFTRVQLANALGTFAAIQTLMNGGHRGNLELIAKAKR